MAIFFCPKAFPEEALRLLKKIPLPHVEGRLDHMAEDKDGKRLCIAAYGNNSVEVVDIEHGTVIHSIRNLNGPQAVLWLPHLNRIVVSNGGDGTIVFFDDHTYTPLSTIKLASDADNLRYDGTYLYAGYGEGGIAIIDPLAMTHMASIKLSGHPEAFQIQSSKNLLYVNVPEKAQINVVDLMSNTVSSVWTLQGKAGNYPMASDDAHNILFIGTRSTPSLLIIDMLSGIAKNELSIGDDVDDVFFDPVHHQLYVSCGEGSLKIFRQESIDSFVNVATMKTTPGARTSLLTSDGRTLYLAVPKHGAEEAEIWVYQRPPIFSSATP